jgi:hypothetical protein
LFISAIRARNAHILRGLCELDRDLSDSRVLVRLGAAHARIARGAVIRGLCVQQAFQRMSGPFPTDGLVSHYGECERPIPRVVLARHLLFVVLGAFLLPLDLTHSIKEAHAAIMGITNRFSEADIAQLWERIRNDWDGALRTILTTLRSKGIPLSGR